MNEKQVNSNDCEWCPECSFPVCPQPATPAPEGLVKFPYTWQDYDGSIVRWQQDKETWDECARKQQEATRKARDEMWADFILRGNPDMVTQERLREFQKALEAQHDYERGG